MLDKILSKMFKTKDYEFSEVQVTEEVIDYIIDLAINSNPNEFIAEFEGKIKDKILIIDGLIFLPTVTSGESAVIYTYMKPPTMKTWGTVHSHPGGIPQPSDADLFTFSRRGLFHMIIATPFRVEDIRGFNHFGEPMDFTII
ncbi:MAG: Mov34/MPN/PAD-1 family protein [Methanobrevibacter sp.]|jgi:proteasome lid subunit RPN8/RPN11|nr:Mov34/MPN/PAD-1 family protein [Methanobrevibacter sp.]